MRARVPLLLLLGLVFLASVSVSFGIAYWEQENPSYNKCLRSCNSEADAYRHDACHARCNLLKEDREYEPEQHEHPQPHQPHEKEGEHEQDEREPWRPSPRPHPPHREHHGQEQKQEQEQEDEGSESESQRQRNPFHFNSNRFQTLFRNQHGHIRVLQRFDQNSRQLQSLQEYRIIEFRSKPNTLLLPNHNDADFLIIVLSGRAIITLVNPDDRNSYNLERGDVQRIPAGTTYYVVNPDDNKTLRLVTLAIPVNNPRNVQSFFLSSTEEQQSYLEGFSKNILEASFNSELEEIERVLFVKEEQRRNEQRKPGGVIVEITKEQIQQLSKHAKSSSKKSVSSEDKPFNLRSLDPIYSNQFGKFYEITPEKNPQLKDLNIYVSNVYIKEGGFMLPHYNSKSPVILVIDEGEANFELVGLRQEQEEQEGPREVRRYRAELSQDDIVVIPASYPVAVNATSNLNFFAFGINAENNQRNFLAGEKDNLLRQLHRQVKDLAFPGSAENVEKLVENLRESYFADAQPQQEGKGRKERQGPLSSILNAFF